MARKVLFSFHYDADNWRVSKVKNMGIVEGTPILSANDWETVKRGGDRSIQNWIDAQMKGRQCTVVLIGRDTASRPWVQYEIKKSWEMGMGLVGIHIHNITDRLDQQTTKGSNPFSQFNVGSTPMSNIVKTYAPPYTTSSYVYNYIAENLSNWVEEAITIRNRY